MHLISLSCGGTTLSVMSSANANVSFTHYHAFSVSESNGVISLTLGTDQYTSPGTQTFNMADTEYFQQQMSAERTAGYNTSESEISVNGYYTNSGWSSNQITYYCYARAKESGTYTKVYEITANASSIYTAGYNASEGEISVNGYYTSSAWSNNEKTYYCYARAKNSGNYTNVYDITVNAQSVYNSGYSAGQSNADLSSYSLHVSKSQGNVYLYLNNGSGTTVKSRTASIAITSLVKSTNSNAWNITVRIDGDTDFYFTKLPTG
jgi:hypothetical protein